MALEEKSTAEQEKTQIALEDSKDASDLEKKVIQQIEYYFGDINLPRDKFLQEAVKADDGWVPLDTMLKFNRLKQLNVDKVNICKALLKSTSGLMEVDEESTKIRRSPSKPLPDDTQERKNDLDARSVYVKGFPVDLTLDQLLEFFGQHGKTDTVVMRRNRPEKAFKGSVFVTFTNVEEEKSFLEKEGIKYEDNELIKMTKEDYFKMKTEQAKTKKKSNTDSNTSEQQKEKAEQKKVENEKRVEDQMTKGAVLFVKGLSKETIMEEVKAFFSDFGQVAWVEHARGDDKALIRFQGAEAEAVLKKAQEAGNGKVVLNNADLESHVLEGEEEKEYWRKMFRDIADQRNRKRNSKFQNRKRKFGGRPYKQGNRDDGEPARKAMKVSEAD